MGTLARILLLATILLAYAHIVVLLDAKDMWWDESLSLQRAEEDPFDLVRGVLWITDGITAFPTIDQHPFFSFLVQGGLIRVAGNSVFVLRYVPAMAATLLAPLVWALGRWLQRRDLAVPTAGQWAAFLVAIHPFLLWYGQEARPYAVWAMLAVLSTYLLLRATEDAKLHRGFAAGFVAAELMFVTSHYYAVFLVPIHALLIFLWLARRSLLQALGLAIGLLAVATAVGLYAVWTIFSQGGGQNFPSVDLGILAPDLLNAFSLGLSVELPPVWMIDLLFGVVALVGAAWGLRSWRAIQRGGWVLPAAVLLPIASVLLLNVFQPLYMNARHLSLLVGPFTLLLGMGLALMWTRRRWVAIVILLIMLSAIFYSTVNYYTQEDYAKDDYTRLGEYMQGRIMPGDVVLYYPPSSWRIFDYYLRMEPVHAAVKAGAPLAVYGVPLLNGTMDDTKVWLQELGRRYRRIWVVKSGTHPYFDLEGEVEAWLRDNFLQVRDALFFSHSSLRAQLYLPEIPVFEALPATVQHPVTAEFGNLIRLAGYDADPPVARDLPSPVRLYWQVIEKPQRRYKYIWSLAEQLPDGQLRHLATVEREPYEGDIPTIYWDPGKTIMEYTEFPPAAAPAAPSNQLFYTLQVYDAETLEKLPLTSVEGGTTAPDGVTVLFPVEEHPARQ